MPAKDPEAFEGIDKHLERKQIAHAAKPTETVSSQMEALQNVVSDQLLTVRTNIISYDFICYDKEL